MSYAPRAPLPPVRAPTTQADPATLDDAALLDAVPYARREACQAYADEVVRRRLAGGIAALDALCRRFRGFGLNAPIAEQAVALDALARIGGRQAGDAVSRLIADGVVADPGLPAALHAAATLGCHLPPDTSLRLLRHPDPGIRAQAATVAAARDDVTAVLLDLLGDLNMDVADSAALALGRIGRTEARARLLRLLHAAPAADLIDAIAPIADDTCVVALNRIGRADPALRPRIVQALQDIDTDLARRVATGLSEAAGPRT